MSRATRMLREEHDTILRMLDATDEVAHQLEGGERVAPETLEGLLEFFLIFAHRWHHDKEEGLLFPLLEEKGLPRAGECVVLMLAEHEQSRLLLSQMAASAEACASGIAPSASQWANTAREYAALLRQHIHRENDVLFVMADNLLTEAEQGKMAEAFEKAAAQVDADLRHRLQAEWEKLVREVLHD